MRKRNKIAAIYKITNEVTNEIYIGGTNDFNRRKGNHLFDLRNNKHHSILLQKCFNDNDIITFSIIENISDCELIKSREQYFIDLLNPLYNISRFSDSTKGTKRTENSKLKMRVAATKKTFRPPRGKDAYDSKSINQLTMDGAFIRKFDSLKDAERAGFGFVNKFSAVCKGKLKSYRGFKYEYADKTLNLFSNKSKIAV